MDSPRTGTGGTLDLLSRDGAAAGGNFQRFLRKNSLVTAAPSLGIVWTFSDWGLVGARLSECLRNLNERPIAVTPRLFPA